MKPIAAVAMLLLLSAPAFAQNEGALKEYFEGKRVVVKIDMPATSDGVDVHPDARRALDFAEYGGRLRSAGAAIKAGQAAMITRIRLKDKLIEFHLDGGGYSGDTSGYVYVPSETKSNREKTLEREVKSETDARRKRQLQDELDDLRRRRERENRRNQALAQAASEEKKQRIQEERLKGGSRFNLRYDAKVPTGIAPDAVMAALAEYADFSSGGTTSGVSVKMPSFPPAAGDVQDDVRKGMTWEEAQTRLGPAEKSSSRMEGTLKVTAASFSRDDRNIEALFVEGVLVKFSISSK